MPFDPKAVDEQLAEINRLHNEMLFTDARTLPDASEAQQFFFLAIDHLNQAESFLRLAKIAHGRDA